MVSYTKNLCFTSVFFLLIYSIPNHLNALKEETRRKEMSLCIIEFVSYYFSFFSTFQTGALISCLSIPSNLFWPSVLVYSISAWRDSLSTVAPDLTLPGNISMRNLYLLLLTLLTSPFFNSKKTRNSLEKVKYFQSSNWRRNPQKSRKAPCPLFDRQLASGPDNCRVVAAITAAAVVDSRQTIWRFSQKAFFFFFLFYI